MGGGVEIGKISGCLSLEGEGFAGKAVGRGKTSDFMRAGI
jgi:hypothetical protein